MSEHTAEMGLPVYRGRLYHQDGSYSPVERWVRAANGDWISLDSERRTSRDILLESDAIASTTTLARVWDAGYFAALHDIEADAHTANPYGRGGTDA